VSLLSKSSRHLLMSRSASSREIALSTAYSPWASCDETPISEILQSFIKCRTYNAVVPIKAVLYTSKLNVTRPTVSYLHSSEKDNIPKHDLLLPAVACKSHPRTSYRVHWHTLMDGHFTKPSKAILPRLRNSVIEATWWASLLPQTLPAKFHTA
jgi:hypothetical protein